MVQLVKKEIEVTKEVSEIFDALAGVVADVKAKKEAAAIFAGNFQKLMLAIQGFELLGEEVKHEAIYKTVAVGGGELAAILLKKEEVAA